jgi:hypothetical protein
VNEFLRDLERLEQAFDRLDAFNMVHEQMRARRFRQSWLKRFIANVKDFLLPVPPRARNKPKLHVVPGKRRLKTHCLRNHEMTPENTYFRGKQRFCRECGRIRHKEWKARQRANNQ